MKHTMVWMLGILAANGVVAAGCRGKSESGMSGPAGATTQSVSTVEQAAQRTVEIATNVAAKTGAAAHATATAVQDVAGQSVEKTGEALEKAGAAVEKTGVEMQK